MAETFAIPEVGAIIVKRVGDDEFILVQNRKKNNGDDLSGAYSFILSTFLCESEGEELERTNETENIRWMRRDMLKEIVDNSPESIIFLMFTE